MTKETQEGTKVEEKEVVDKDVYETVKRDMLEEREQKRALKKELEELKAQEPTETTETTETAVMDANAKAEVALKLATDPTFKARHEIVQDEMLASGATLEEADATIKSKLYDKLVSDSSTEEQPIKQINTQATPEPTVAQNTGDVLVDAVNNQELPEELRNALRGKVEQSERMRNA